MKPAPEKADKEYRIMERIEGRSRIVRHSAGLQPGVRVSTLSDREFRAYREMRRRNEKRMHGFVLFLVVLICVAIGTILLTTITSEAQEEEEAVYYKYYTSYYVQEGDTIWDLADAYTEEGDPYTRTAWVKEVLGMNSLGPNGDIHVGQHLSVPYYSTEYKL